MAYENDFGITLLNGKLNANILVKNGHSSYVRDFDRFYAIYNLTRKERTGMHTVFVGVTDEFRKIFVVGSGVTSGVDGSPVSVVLSTGRCVDHDYLDRAIDSLAKEHGLENYDRVLPSPAPVQNGVDP